jgi:anti-sigma regulatory factor (Ser/Thr protein kinase)
VPAPTELLAREFAAEHVTGLRHTVRDTARAAGLHDDALYDFVVAVHELVTNAVRHGGGGGRLRLCRDGDTLVCEITDHGDGFSREVPIGAAPPPEALGGRGIMLAHRLAGTLLITGGAGGVTAAVAVCLPAASAPDT